MKKTILFAAVCIIAASCAGHAGKPVDDAVSTGNASTTVRTDSAELYDETIDPMAQIDAALVEAGKSGRFVVCQVGGNWCRWCLMFADFIGKDEEIAKLISDNFVYIHVDYDKKKKDIDKLDARLGGPGRFGFPCLVVLSPDGKVVHIQDSSFLEEGEGYNRDKVLRFFSRWTPDAVKH